MPNLSWRVHILPFLEDRELHSRFRLNEPWDGEHNIKLLHEMPDLYKTADEPTKTALMMLIGKDAGYGGTHGLQLHDYGSKRTILVLRADKAVPWTKPVDLPFVAENPISAFDEPDWHGFVALRVDGSVIRIPLNVSKEELSAMIIRHEDENPFGSDY